MATPMSALSLFKNSSVVGEPFNQKQGFAFQNSGSLAGVIGLRGEEDPVADSEGFIGALEVYIHQARDIQNICIYHNQDVYAKLCLTSNPEMTVSTKIINGGGRNPVFNENLQLKVRSLESTLKCEIWMLSRVKNYLQDQLLGFALVPISDVLLGNGKLDQELSLSSTDLFHSPAGLVQLSISYSGASPEVLAVPTTRISVNAKADASPDSEIIDSIPCEFDKIEFPDPRIVNENQQMVSEYFGIHSPLDSQSSGSFATSDTDNHISSNIGVGDQVVESFSSSSLDSLEVHKSETPPSSVSTDWSSGASITRSSQSSVDDTLGDRRSPDEEHRSPLKEKGADDGEADSEASGGVLSSSISKPLVSLKMEPQPMMVQQDIVDMYMKSMQQFTESLAKMKLPLDIEKENSNLGSATSKTNNDQKSATSKGTGSKVFYGSRAFF